MRQTTLGGLEVRMTGADRLALYAYNELRRAFYYDPNKRLAEVSRPRSDTLKLEMALVEVAYTLAARSQPLAQRRRHRACRLQQQPG